MGRFYTEPPGLWEMRLVGLVNDFQAELDDAALR
jgi:hypothetical protein